MVFIFTKQQLRRLILPLIIEQFLAVAVGMADTIMIAGVGESAVSGISVVDTINILIINVFAALATGGAVVASQYLGRREPENACVASKQLIWTTAIVSLFVGGFAFFGNEMILGTVYKKLDADVMNYATTYFTLSTISYPFIAVYNACAAIFRSQGNSKVSMLTSGAMNIINICGNAIFICGFKLEVFGAGLATLISRATACVIMLILVTRKKNTIHVDRLFVPQFRKRMVANILKIGIPTGLENSMFQLGKILVQGVITSFGTIAITANAVAGNLVSIPIIPASAIGLALVTVMGQCVGAGEYEQAKMYTKRLMKLAYILMAGANVLIILFCEPIVSIYKLSAETAELAIAMILAHSIFGIIFWPSAFTLPNALRASGDAKFTMAISVGSMWACRIGLSYVFAHTLGFGALGVWYAMVCDWVVRATLFIWRFAVGKWRTKVVIKD